LYRDHQGLSHLAQHKQLIGCSNSYPLDDSKSVNTTIFNVPNVIDILMEESNADGIEVIEVGIDS